MIGRLTYAFAFILLLIGNVSAQRNCASHDVLQHQLQSDPAMQQRMDAIEQQVQDYIRQNPTTDRAVVTIPVVFHVVYRTTAENISDARLQSQIDVLNADFRKLNSDVSLAPALFSGLAADCEIQFCLAQQTPAGVLTNGINRKLTTTTSFGTGDNVKRAANGGVDPWNTAKYLNIWICNIGGGILGYAQFPGGAAATDGVVLDYRYTGTTGATAPFNLGRTATHEVGHWLNLRHIWGDANCGSDLVTDTPTHNTSNGGCPAYPHLSTCTGTPIEMTMNYMDYTDDVCMYMFTSGQKARMQAIITGSRASLFTNNAACTPGTSGPSCGVPATLTTTGITTTGAAFGWGAVTGATAYKVEYKLASATTWTAVTGVTATTYSVSGLTAATAYNWRVTAVCGTTTGTSTANQSFTTQTVAASCGTPGTLTTTAITTSGATFSWGAVSGASSYKVGRKLASATTWTNVTVTATTYTATGLTASTAYNWRVNAVCGTTAGTATASQSFSTTSSVATCNDPYESNNTRANAKAIPVNTTITASIGNSTDRDYLGFANAAGTTNIKVELTNLAADYDMILYRGSSKVGVSENTGTTNETVIYNTATVATTFVAYVYGYNGAFNANSCYSLKASLSSSIWRTDGSTSGEVTETEIPVEFAQFGMWPNPAAEFVTVDLFSEQEGDAEVRILDISGRTMQVKQIAVTAKLINRTELPLAGLASGVYFVQVRNGSQISTQKLVVQE
jgi:Pregnancy-associated plasma protein-A/Secretion system C-terminal sorting domain/Fibronectin type III domain